MRCEEIMKKDVECLSLQSTAQEAAKKMREQNVGFLPICDGSKKVLGTVTDRDLVLRVMADGAKMNTAVKDIMTHEVVACRPDDDLKKAAGVMATRHKSRIMCVDLNGRLVGVISLSDIAQRDDGTAVQTLRQVTEREARA
jgi:CBS domain-containing protein